MGRRKHKNVAFVQGSTLAEVGVEAATAEHWTFIRHYSYNCSAQSGTSAVKFSLRAARKRDRSILQHRSVLTTGACRILQELEASSTDDEDPGGLHIGGIVIRAPARSRAAEQQGRGPRRQAAAAPGSSSRPAGTRSRSHQLQQAETEHFFASEDSLDDELRDYLDNVKQVSWPWTACTSCRACQAGSSSSLYYY
jgi:hypothetical protein